MFSLYTFSKSHAEFDLFKGHKLHFSGFGNIKKKKVLSLRRFINEGFQIFYADQLCRVVPFLHAGVSDLD